MAPYFHVNNLIFSNSSSAKVMEAEARQLRQTGKRIAASKSAARRLLAATGMYTSKGEIKPRFR